MNRLKNGYMARRKYTTDYLVERGIFPETWKEDIINMGKNGKNKIYFSNYLNLHRNTFYNLMERDPEFKDVIDIALKFSQQWWIENVRESFESGTSQKMNSTLWKYYMSNVYRDDWKEETSIDVTSKGEKIKDNTLQIEVIKPKEEEDGTESN